MNGLILQALELFRKYPFLPNRKSFFMHKDEKKAKVELELIR